MKRIYINLIFCILVCAVISYFFGYTRGLDKGLKECNEWVEMYHRHKKGYLEIIEERDSLIDQMLYELEKKDRGR